MATINAKCPNCSARFSVDEKRVGKKVQCRKCGANFVALSPDAQTTQAVQSEAGVVSFRPARALAGAGVSEIWKPGDVILDDYMVERLLGEGGMGTVYLVRSQSTNQPFAVKMSKLRGVASRRNFLVELQTWIGLPEHPHLAGCRFFRTVGDGVLIFAEYIEGGSLAQWIRDRKLTELAHILDVAIQFAWGLHVAHELGLVHQDVKPGNVLMSGDGVAKITDFGLARARSATREGGALGPGRSSLVSYGGRTPAYCSPEQAEIAAERKAGLPRAKRPRLTRRTDVWSWGLSVLEMFAGEVTWMAGEAAPEVLENYLEMGSGDPQLPEMPAAVVEALKKCFRRDPVERWDTMAEVVEVLRRVYSKTVGREHSRELPVSPTQAGSSAPPYERPMFADGTQLKDPRRWIIMALQAGGQRAAEADSLMLPRDGSRKAQAIADLAAYEEARTMFERLIASGRKGLEVGLAVLLAEEALIHNDVGDIPGALTLSDRAIEIYEDLVKSQGRSELAVGLANVYGNKASMVKDLGNTEAAVVLCGQAISIYERLVNQEDRSDLAPALAVAYTHNAALLGMSGDAHTAILQSGRAIKILERLVHQEGRSEFARSLADGYASKAYALLMLKDEQAAAFPYDRAIEIYERLVNQEGRPELADRLASAYFMKALAMQARGDSAASALYDRAIDIYERTLGRKDRKELAALYLTKGLTASELGDNRRAIMLFDRAIKIYERLVNREGRLELVNGLARGYVSKPTALVVLGNVRASVPLFDCAIAICQRLMDQEGRPHLPFSFPAAYEGKAVAVAALGNARASVPLLDRAIKMWEGLVKQKGTQEFADALARAKNLRVAALSDVGKPGKAALRILLLGVLLIGAGALGIAPVLSGEEPTVPLCISVAFLFYGGYCILKGMSRCVPGDRGQTQRNTRDQSR